MVPWYIAKQVVSFRGGEEQCRILPTSVQPSCFLLGGPGTPGLWDPVEDRQASHGVLLSFPF